ncbi:MAG: serine protease [Spirochaetaceae bacterium]|nr:MAG: serine protease [Spirochaetaceae bacterium]
MSNLTMFSDELANLVEALSPGLLLLGGGDVHERTAFRFDDGHYLTYAWQADTGDEVSARDTSGAALTLTVAGFDPVSGLAVLAAPQSESGAATVSPAPRHATVPRVGELSLALAFPSDHGIEARLAMIRCVGKSTVVGMGRSIASYYQTDGRMHRGFAGAPVFSCSGDLLGMLAPAGRGREDLIVPAGELSTMIERIKRGDADSRAYLGVNTQAVEEGLLVTGVEADSPAAQAGIRTGDFLVSLHDTRLSTPEDLWMLLSSRSGGDVVTVKLERGGVPQELEVTLIGLDLEARKHRRGRGHGRGGNRQGRGGRRSFEP